MSIMLSRMDVGQTPPIKYLTMTDGESVALGEALVLSAGKLTKCSATAKPAYIAVGVKNAAGEVPVIAVQSYMTFETTLQAAGDALKKGDKVTLHTDGLQVTATTASGVAEIVSMEGTAAGSTVLVKF
ncbi:hypothetical protein [Oscillibacter sp.]|uniref:hypothetical protein n=1 Tax=Oscillibacter sp. TaxID=1945593 RepID=UPI001B6995A8|nr:hypothetical protein [Oscillibacter sp.]MBP3509644.1 hypothetical protein [Oscillibacter sp.]